MSESTKKPKTLSAGVIVYDGKKIIIGHATGGKHWDIPKGKLDPGEVAIAAAIRELEEETSLKVSYRELVSLGIFKYKRDKDLALYLWRVSNLPLIKDLACKSTFVNSKGITVPELDKFMHVTWKQAFKKTVPAMTTVLTSVQNVLKQSER